MLPADLHVLLTQVAAVLVEAARHLLQVSRHLQGAAADMTTVAADVGVTKHRRSKPWIRCLHLSCQNMLCCCCSCCCCGRFCTAPIAAAHSATAVSHPAAADSALDMVLCCCTVSLRLLLLLTVPSSGAMPSYHSKKRHGWRQSLKFLQPQNLRHTCYMMMMMVNTVRNAVINCLYYFQLCIKQGEGYRVGLIYRIVVVLVVVSGSWWVLLTEQHCSNS
jgi:Na+/melibiose symporter-like transporter